MPAMSYEEFMGVKPKQAPAVVAPPIIEAPSSSAVPPSEGLASVEGKELSAPVAGAGLPDIALPGSRVDDKKSYLSRALDIPKDISDEFSSGIDAIKGAPAKMAGTGKNPYEALMPRMLEMGLPEDRAKALIDKMQFGSGLMDSITGPSQAVLSPIFGPVRSMASRPLEENLGIPKEATEFAAGLAMGRPRMRTAPRAGPLAPTAEELQRAAREGYRVADSLGIQFRPSAAPTIANQIEAALTSPAHGSYRPHTAANTFRELDYLRDNGAVHLADIESVRHNLGRIVRDGVNPIGERTADAGAASRAIQLLDDFVLNINPSQVTQTTAHLLPAMQGELTTARANYAAYMRANLIDRMIDQAGRQAGRSGSGANIENSLRQRFDSIINSPKRAQRYNDHELDMMREIVEGTATRNVARRVGKLAPTGIVSGAGSVGLGALVGGKAGMEALPLIGAASKYFADRAVRRSATRVADATRQRSPLFNDRILQHAQQPPLPAQFRYEWPFAVAGAGRGEDEEP